MSGVRQPARKLYRFAGRRVSTIVTATAECVVQVVHQIMKIEKQDDGKGQIDNKLTSKWSAKLQKNNNQREARSQTCLPLVVSR